MMKDKKVLELELWLAHANKREEKSQSQAEIYLEYVAPWPIFRLSHCTPNHDMDILNAWIGI